MAEADKSKPLQRRSVLILAAVVAVAVSVGGIAYFRGIDNVSESAAAPSKENPDVPMEELMAKGPLPDIIIGNPKAPITIVEYASMTCPHCAEFHNAVLPKVKTKYIDTGKAKLIFREFPLDVLAARASMLARCAGPDRYVPMVDALFETQDTWAVPGDEAEAMSRLLSVARQAGMSKEAFDKCMANQTLYDDIVKERARGANDFGVNSTPTFFIDGKNLGPLHEIENFDAAIAKDPNASASAEKTDQSKQ